MHMGLFGILKLVSMKKKKKKKTKLNFFKSSIGREKTNKQNITSISSLKYTPTLILCMPYWNTFLISGVLKYDHIYQPCTTFHLKS